MASSLRVLILLLSSVLLCHATTTFESDRLVKDPSTSTTDADLLQFALNLEHLKANFFLYGALGYGLDKVEPDLVGGGPLPIGAKAVVLNDTTRRIIDQSLAMKKLVT